MGGSSPLPQRRLCRRCYSENPRQRTNVRKQATQIRQCLIQAREYYDAATAVTLATKPVLLYYSVMSLALAEILLKQDGASSLDRAREHHRHHGLEFRIDKVFEANQALAVSASTLKAVPLIGNKTGRAFGTFAPWHRSARELPLCGWTTTTHEEGTNSAFSALLGVPDTNLSDIPRAGYSLLTLLRHVPHMRDFLVSHNVFPELVRAKLERQIEQTGRATTSVMLHPEPGDVLNRLIESINFPPRSLEYVHVSQIGSGFALNILNQEGQPATAFRLPHGSMWNESEIRFWPVDQPLNEFGFIYASLFIAGNLARYYPDVWLREVGDSSPLAQAIELLVDGAQERMALLTLSEMRRTLLVVEA
jgi:hypothetical protein